jgi:hypothetical protein
VATTDGVAVGVRVGVAVGLGVAAVVGVDVAAAVGVGVRVAEVAMNAYAPRSTDVADLAAPVISTAGEPYAVDPAPMAGLVACNRQSEGGLTSWGFVPPEPPYEMFDIALLAGPELPPSRYPELY